MAGKTIYNSGLKNEQGGYNTDYTLEDAYVKPGRCVIAKVNLAQDLRLDLFQKADVIYSEPAWVAGYDLFSEKAGEPKTEYRAYEDAIVELVSRLGKPAFIACGARLGKRLVEARGGVVYKNYKIPSSRVYLWSNEVVLPKDRRDFGQTWLVGELAKRYKVGADFSCGYGLYLRRFKEFIATDINPYCLGYLKHIIETEE